MKVIVILTLCALAFAQEDLDASVSVVTEWPQNDDTNAGAIVAFAYSDVGEGSCSVGFPGDLLLFHVMNGHIVSGDGTNPIEGNYKVAAPAEWEMINGTLNALVIFRRDAIYNMTEVTFTCDPDDVAELSVYSFPQNILVKEASSNVHYRPGFVQGDVLTITLPNQVARFNITGADSRWVVSTSDDGLTTTVSGFVNDAEVTDQKEVHFSLDYLPADENSDDIYQNWFSAASVTVSVARDEPGPEK